MLSKQTRGSGIDPYYFFPQVLLSILGVIPSTPGDFHIVYFAGY